MRTRGVSILAALLLAFSASTASAAPIFQFNALNEIFFKNGERVVDPITGIAKDPLLAVPGDIVYGVLQAQEIVSGNVNIWEKDNIPTPIDTFTGYFLGMVVALPFPPPGGGGVAFVPAPFDPFGIFAPGELAAGAMMKLFVDDGAAPPATDASFGGTVAVPTIAASIGTHVDGTLFAVLTILDTDGAGPLGTGYWYTLPSSAGSGTSFVGLNALVAPFLLSPVNDPEESIVNSTVQFYSTTELIFPGSTCGLWEICSNDPAVIHVAEPTSMALVGLGLFGLAMLARRRRK